MCKNVHFIDLVTSVQYTLCITTGIVMHSLATIPSQNKPQCDFLVKS